MSIKSAIKNWITIYFRWNFTLTYAPAGYFDSRPRINIGLIFFCLTIRFPFKTKWDECDPPEYGVKIHHNTFWIYRGGEGNEKGGNKWWTFTFPWAWEWVRTSALKKDGSWEHETRKSKSKNFWDDEKWDDILFHETHPYTYVLKSGEHQYRKAKIGVREREWRWKWFTWLPFPRTKSKRIDVKFSDEVGELSGTWKGGTMGCDYEMKKNETPLQCLRRMESERTFR